MDDDAVALWSLASELTEDIATRTAELERVKEKIRTKYRGLIDSSTGTITFTDATSDAELTIVQSWKMDPNKLKEIVSPKIWNECTSLGYDPDKGKKKISQEIRDQARVPNGKARVAFK